MRIAVTKFGSISETDTHFILSILHETFDRLQPHDRELVDVLLFETSSSLSFYFQQEHQRSGVVSDRFDDSFLAIHDAWRGVPRISVSLERLNQLPQQVAVGALRHEVGHAVLHGEIKYYLLPRPEALEKLGVSREYVNDLLYLTSIAVKDYEVTKLLTSRGFEEDQRAYVNHLLTPSDEDSTTWLLAKKNRSTQLLFTVSCLKQLCSAVPLTTEQSRPPQVHSIYPFLPERLSIKIDVILQKVKRFPVGETIENIERLARLIGEELL